MEKTSIFIITFLIIGILGLGFYSNNLQIENRDLDNENLLYTTILNADSEISRISINKQKADKYYDLASLSYEDSDYKDVESNCVLSREYYFEVTEDTRTLKVELQSLEFQDELIDLYIKALDKSIDLKNNLYEACEHFESASRYYDKYYNKVDYKESDFNMGGAEIENMNEKIREHDSNVGKYNDLLAEFGVELKKRLKDEEKS